jgi:hypothetical protein
MNEVKEYELFEDIRSNNTISIKQIKWNYKKEERINNIEELHVKSSIA